MKNKQIILLSKEDNALSLEYLADEIFLNIVLEKKYKNKKYKIITSKQLPELFFEYPFCFDVSNWEDLTFNIINLDKAKIIQLDKFRSARTPLLTSLDVDFMRAVETANTSLQQEIASKKQALRDVTKTELPDTLEGIKNTWPEILGNKPL